MKRLDLSVLRVRAKKALDALEAGGLDPIEFAEFVYTPEGDQTENVISHEAFFDPEAPAGRYAFRVLNGQGAIVAEGEGFKLELRAGGAQEHLTGAGAVAAACGRVLAHNAFEVERCQRRLADEERRNDTLRAKVDELEEVMRLRNRRIAQLELELESGGADEFSELMEVFGEVAMRAFGLDEPGDQGRKDKGVAFEVVVDVVRRNADVQRSIRQVVGDAPLMALGIGGES
ncbi:Hypothetical protein CAP_7661 [Chondromyces apiculatus DSM 436]|uniref:Uncharacterized protein n=2 Tax=Chondromyces apiculatus TaxID=51 RepID=A0A017SY52_9BACT|nr:Hypothetical protein CAP_7661 [Chondromyces apiculatus DSM 436]